MSFAVTLRTVCAVLLLVSAAFGQDADDYNQYEFSVRPAPDWVEMVELGDDDPRLRGIYVPAGVHVEIVAEEPTVVNPVDISFDDHGELFVLEWTQADHQELTSYEETFRDGTTATIHRMAKTSHDLLKKLSDRDRDGSYEAAEIVLDTLELPSSTTFLDDALYVPAIGKVVRWTRSQDGAYANPEVILRGLCGFHHHQASGVALTHDGHLLVTTGDDDNRAEGTDGSRATVLRTGAVFRCRPDGSAVTEFARGFRNPYRCLAHDDTFNLFHADNDNEDGSKFQGIRLMHVLEGADYGWRLVPGTVCCRSDFARGAEWGESPGKVPAMIKTGRGAPAGLLIYNGTAFPEFVRGLLIYPDVFRKSIRAYRVEPRGSTFAVVEQFELMRSENDLFRPCEAVVGPDGAIYVCDWATNSGGAGMLWGDGVHGRIYRLTWKGSDAHPAMQRGPMGAWAEIARVNDLRLSQILDGSDVELRMRAQRELVRRVKERRSNFSFAQFALDDSRTTAGRATAVGGLCQLMSDNNFQAIEKLLGDEQDSLRRLACDAVGRYVTDERYSDQLVERVAGCALDDPSAAVRRAAALALGRLAAHSASTDDVDDQIVSHLLAAYRRAGVDDPHLRDGCVRGIEWSGEAARKRLLAMAQSDADAERETAVGIVECMRNRVWAGVLDAILLSQPQKLDDGQLERIVVAYRNIMVEPPIPVTAVARWLDENPSANPAVQLAAVQTIGLAAELGKLTTENSAMAAAARRLLGEDDEPFRITTIQAIGSAQLKPLVPELAAALTDFERSVAERQAIVAALSGMRSEPLPFGGGMSPPGVENVLDTLAEVVQDSRHEALRIDALNLLASVDFSKAEPLASELLSADDASLVAGAIRVLGTNPNWADRLAERFLEGGISTEHRASIEQVLRHHLPSEPDSPRSTLLERVVSGNHMQTLTAAQLIESAEQGDPELGRGLFFAKKSQCGDCHQISGRGGNVGPNLTDVWKTHSLEKLIESILQPSKEIKEGYGTWTVETNDGRIYSGLKIVDTGEATVIRNANGDDVRIVAEDIADKYETNVSLMPEATVTNLARDEIGHLLAFLKSEAAQAAVEADEGK